MVLYDEIKKVSGVVYPTYKEACYASAYLEDDKEYVDSIKDVAHWAAAEHLRELFGTLLSQKELTTPLTVWLQTWHLLAQDFQYKRRHIIKIPEQKGVYDTLMNTVETGTCSMYFVYGYGGTGKTFLWKTLASGIRRRGDIVLNVASSGIASLLMSGGRTAHSRFHIPINIDEISTCLISAQSDMGALLKNAGSLGYSKRFTSRHYVTEIREFAEWILKVRDDEPGEENDGEVDIDVPKEVLIDEADDPVSSIVDFTYPNILDNINDLSYFKEKVVLAPTNEVVDNINEHLLDKFPGEEMVYLNCDSVDKTKSNGAIDQSIFSLKVISGLKFFSVPNHRLALKLGVPVMLLRNIDQPNGLCSRTRLQVIEEWTFACSID
nr:ATP-dependent DNA helicase PIF1-like [Tanacetum cinerariifolium]